MDIPINLNKYSIVFLADSSLEKTASEFISRTSIAPEYTMGIDIKDTEKINNISEIAAVGNAFVILFFSENNTDKISGYSNELKKADIKYSYYIFFSEEYSIGLNTLTALNDRCFTDKNNNSIELDDNVHGKIVFNFSGSNSVISLGKCFYSKDLYISVTGINSKILIGNYALFHSGEIECGDMGKISVGANTRIMNNSAIRCKAYYVPVNSDDAFVRMPEPSINIGKHVKLCNNTVVLPGTEIENGSVIAPYSVVDSFIPSCSEAAGNRAVVVKNNVSWTNDSLSAYRAVDRYDIQDREAYKYFNRKTVFVHGSCVSRHIINYSSALNIKYHLFQNPIHTMFYKGIKISPDMITVENNSKSMNRILSIEFSKDQINCIKNNISDFFLMDLADIRWSFFEFPNKPGVRLYAHSDIFKTLNNLKNKSEQNKKEYDFVEKEFSSISLEEWKGYIDRYVDIILNYYSKRQIIFIKVPIAKGYYEEGKYIPFQEDRPVIMYETLFRQLEDYIINEKLKGVKVIEIEDNVFSDIKHPFGNSPLHYTKDVYKKMVMMIDDHVRSL